jgi:hypothetical protein
VSLEGLPELGSAVGPLFRGGGVESGFLTEDGGSQGAGPISDSWLGWVVSRFLAGNCWRLPPEVA